MKRNDFIKNYKSDFPLIYNMMKDASDIEWLAKIKIHSGVDLEDVKLKISDTDIKALELYESELLQDLQDAADKDESIYDKELNELKFVEESRENARDLYREMQGSESWLTKHFTEILTLILILSTVLYIAAMLSNPDIIRRMEGITEFIKNVVLLTIGFWFGSSKGSKVKDDMMYREMNEPDW